MISRRKHPSDRSKSTHTRKRIIYGSLVVTGIALVAVALWAILGDVAEDIAARTEYEQLRENFPIALIDEPPEIGLPGGDEDTPEARDADEATDDADGDDDEEAREAEAESRALRDFSLEELSNINRDFIGWINAGTRINYPVVRGSDNVRYLNTTFMGNRNSAGAIFMDYRNTQGFDEYISIIYGHNTRGGTMFSQLNQYLDPTFLQNNPNIRITTRDGRTLNYRIFAAILTDAWDAAYSIGFIDSTRAAEVFPNAPANANNFLLLSTCTASADDDERVLVFAYR